VSDEQQVSTGVLGQSSTGLAAAASRIGHALTRLSSALSGTGDAFGSDSISGPFARDYQPLVDQAMTGCRDGQAIQNYRFGLMITPPAYRGGVFVPGVSTVYGQPPPR
jgi:hypothetical protein